MNIIFGEILLLLDKDKYEIFGRAIIQRNKEK